MGFGKCTKVKYRVGSVGAEKGSDNSTEHFVCVRQQHEKLKTNFDITVLRGKILLKELGFENYCIFMMLHIFSVLYI